MTQNNSNKGNQSKGGLGLLAFISGAVAGATAVFLSKKENREKTQKAVCQAVDKAKEVADDITEQSKEVKEKAEVNVKKIADKVEKVKKKVDKQA